MPLLTPRGVHLDAPLSNLTLAYLQDQSVFIADKVFPVVGVDKQSDQYYIYDRATMNQSGNVRKLAPRTEVNRVGQKISNEAYFADVYGLGMDFDDQTLANEDAALDIRSAGAQQLMNQLLIHREEMWADKFFSAGVWGQPDIIPATLWDLPDATPIQDVTDAMRRVQLASGGFKPNTMVVGKRVRDFLINNADILQRLNGGSTIDNPALINDAKLAEIFGVQKFLVIEAVKNSNGEGLLEKPSWIGDQSCLLVYTPASAGLMTPAAGLTFAWNNVPGVSNLGVTVESFSDDALRRQQVAEHIQVKMSYDMKIVGADLGVFFPSPISSE